MRYAQNVTLPQCRKCGALLRVRGIAGSPAIPNECWYCHQSLSEHDIVTIETTPKVWDDAVGRWVEREQQPNDPSLVEQDWIGDHDWGMIAGSIVLMAIIGLCLYVAFHFVRKYW